MNVFEIMEFVKSCCFVLVNYRTVLFRLAADPWFVGLKRVFNKNTSVLTLPRMIL